MNILKLSRYDRFYSPNNIVIFNIYMTLRIFIKDITLYVTCYLSYFLFKFLFSSFKTFLIKRNIVWCYVTIIEFLSRAGSDKGYSYFFFGNKFKISKWGKTMFFCSVIKNNIANHCVFFLGQPLTLHRETLLFTIVYNDKDIIKLLNSTVV